MTESAALIDSLRLIAAVGMRVRDDRPDDAWLREGLCRGHYHELYAVEAGDGASGAGFAIALALAANAMPLMWLRTEAGEREGGRLHGTGLAELGLSPAAIVLAVVADETALLRAAADAARCPGMGTVLVEAWGRAPGIDLTATRRLTLAAEASGVTIICLRVAAEPTLSAAATRWGVAADASTPMAANAPGAPAFAVECLRRRGAPAGSRWRVEWNRDAKTFLSRDAAPLSGAGLPLAGGGAAARHPPAPVRRAG